eukprot:13514868-Ditylum_brightwellii.AAC.1
MCVYGPHADPRYKIKHHSKAEKVAPPPWGKGPNVKEKNQYWCRNLQIPVQSIFKWQSGRRSARKNGHQVKQVTPTNDADSDHPQTPPQHN